MKAKIDKNFQKESGNCFEFLQKPIMIPASTPFSPHAAT